MSAFLNLTRGTPEVDICCGDMVLRYRLRGAFYAGERYDVTELILLPADCAAKTAKHRAHASLHPSLAGKLANGSLGGLVADLAGANLLQVAVRGQVQTRAFAAGNTMLYSGTTSALKFVDQTVQRSAGRLRIETRMRTAFGLECVHCVDWSEGAPGVRMSARAINEGDEPLTLEHLDSFCLNGLSPFAEDDAPHRMRVHAFRSAWSAEGRHEDRSLEELHMERSWAGYSCNVHRIGALGSLPVRGHFPFMAVEDRGAGVLWGAQLAWHGPWQIELSRREDPLMLSGGIADFQFGHWAKRLQPGECFATPEALVSVCSGDIDTLCDRLVRLQADLAHAEPESEQDLPVIFNEWCTTWGNPTHDSLKTAAERLPEIGAGYMVIDDGWAERPGKSFQQNGDWIINRTSFPDGLRATARMIREHGLVPGIWFEFEVCNEGSKAFAMTDHHLQLHGQAIQVGSRRFWDLRDPFTRNYLTEKVIHLLRDNEFGYLKVDYNDSIGIGADHPDSIGEGLREHLVAVEEFFREIRSALPDLVLENCSSGGHRLVPNFVGLSSMSSFSDAHEGVDIPIIAANLHRLIPAARNQVWCVVRPDDDARRLGYGLAATFLGRMCLSGDVAQMQPDHVALLREAVAFYRAAVPVIRSGSSRFVRPMGDSWRYPKGAQAVLRQGTGDAADQLMVVAHAFEGAPERLEITLPAGDWSIATVFHPGTIAPVIDGQQLSFSGLNDFSAAAVLLRRM